MFILFIYSSLCIKKHIFDFVTRQYPKLIQLYIHPMELVELKIRKGIGSFFKEMYENKFISIEIESQNTDGSIRTRGPYDQDSLIIGIVFISKNYKIILYNDGPYVEYISIAFAENFSFLCEQHFKDAFPATWLFHPDDSFNSLSNPIIFNYDHQNAVWGVAILIPCLVIVYLIYTFACQD